MWVMVGVSSTAFASAAASIVTVCGSFQRVAPAGSVPGTGSSAVKTSDVIVCPCALAKVTPWFAVTAILTVTLAVGSVVSCTRYVLPEAGCSSIETAPPVTSSSSTPGTSMSLTLTARGTLESAP